MRKPIIGITMGDAAGIGPEIIMKALSQRDVYELCRPVVIGSAEVLQLADSVVHSGARFRRITAVREAGFAYGTIDVLEPDGVEITGFQWGEVDAECGRAAVRYTEVAGRLALAGTLDAMVSAPLNKESMRKAGYSYEGQTEILAKLTSAEKYAMLLILDELRIMLLSTHLPLVDACKLVTKERVLEKLELAWQGLRLFDIKEPVIAVAGLNPHAGEGKLFGREEVEEIIPAIEEATRKGINVQGPVPADTVMVRARRGEFDLVLALYHDQGNTPLKLLGFGNVVTLLIGLPIIRTSTGHGTAFDIAGSGRADPTNLGKAIELAAVLARRRLLTGSAGGGR